MCDRGSKLWAVRVTFTRFDLGIFGDKFSICRLREIPVDGCTLGVKTEPAFALTGRGDPIVRHKSACILRRFRCCFACSGHCYFRNERFDPKHLVRTKSPTSISVELCVKAIENRVRLRRSQRYTAAPQMTCAEILFWLEQEASRIVFQSLPPSRRRRKNRVILEFTNRCGAIQGLRGSHSRCSCLASRNEECRISRRHDRNT